jgi:hypothetical protein
VTESRQRLLFTVLLALLLGVIISVPPARRTDDVGRRPSQRIERGGGFLPTPDGSIPPAMVVPPSTAIDRSGPACTTMPDAQARTIVELERDAAREDDLLGTAPIEGSRSMYAVPKAGRASGVEGMPLGSTPAAAEPVAGTRFVATSGVFGAEPARRPYAAIERYDPAAAAMAPVLMLENCDAVTVAPPPDPADETAHLWAVVAADAAGGGTVIEVDPATQRVVWSMRTESVLPPDLIDLDGRTVLMSVDNRGLSEVQVMDKATHTVTSSYPRGDGRWIPSPPGQLWMVSGDDQHATLTRLDPSTGNELLSFDLGGAVRYPPSDVSFSGGCIWISEASAVVRRDGTTFAELARIETGDANVAVSAGPDDVWLQLDRSDVQDGTAVYLIELQHLDGRTGDVRSTRRFRALPGSSSTPDAELRSLTVDADGFWYESRRRAPDGGDEGVESSETLFRYDGS